jgi:hypothetical protein
MKAASSRSPKLIRRLQAPRPVKKRRALRDAWEGTRHEHQVGVFVAPLQGTEPARRATSALGSLLYVPGAILLLAAFGIALLNWLAVVLGVPMLPDILAPYVAWTPVLFVIGLVLSVLGSVISPSVEKFVLLFVFVAGYLAIWLGIV